MLYDGKINYFLKFIAICGVVEVSKMEILDLSGGNK